MKKIIHFLTAVVLIILIMSSCKKQDIVKNDSVYHMRFKTDGIQKEYILTSGYCFEPKHCIINAGTNDGTGNGLTINVYASELITGGKSFSVSETVPAPGNYVPACYISYSVNSPSVYNYGSWIAEPTEHSAYECHITITEFDATHIKGSFSGRVRERLGSQYINITDGTFNVKRY